MKEIEEKVRKWQKRLKVTIAKTEVVVSSRVASKSTIKVMDVKSTHRIQVVKICLVLKAVNARHETA